MTAAVVTLPERVAPAARPEWRFITAEPDEMRNHIIRTARPGKVMRKSPTPETIARVPE